MKAILIHNADTVGTSGWYMEQALNRTKKPEEFYLLRPNNVMKQIGERKLAPPDYFLLWEGGLNSPDCTKDLANVKVPKAVWVSDSYPVQGYMDYFPFEVAWAKHTKPDMVLMAQKSKIEDMKKATGIDRVYWMPFAGDPIYHREIDVPIEYDLNFVGTINPNFDHADRRKIEALQRLSNNGFNIHAVIAHDGFKEDPGFKYINDRPTLANYSKEICRGKVGFNRCIANDLTMRTFEIPLMNRPLFTNGGDGINDIFAEYNDVWIYNDDNIVEKMKILVEEPDLRETLAIQSREIVLRHHTYEKRVEQIEYLVNNDVQAYEKSLNI
jgi:spore maturation protein CgeB